MVKIAIAEDVPFLAQSLQEKLEEYPNFQVKFVAMDGQDLLTFIEADSNIDLVLMDIQMPVLDGIQATRKIKEKFPHIRVVMLTVVDGDQQIYDAVQAGANGYLLKESKPEEIKAAIEKAMVGGVAASPQILERTFMMMRDPGMVNKSRKSFGLTKREREVFEQLAKGLDYKNIARNLIISPNTVRRHIENIYKKLNVVNKVEAIQKGHQHKIL